jgi:hypothetical protein
MGGNPVPSSPLVAEISDSKAEPVLAPWTVHAYPLEAEDAIVLLCACMGKKVLAPGIISGNDLLWRAAARNCWLAGSRTNYCRRKGRGRRIQISGNPYFPEMMPGVAKLAKPNCPCCKGSCPETSAVPGNTCVSGMAVY